MLQKRKPRVSKTLKNVCSQCGKECAIDKEKSTSKWNVYDMSKPCECGNTKYILKLCEN